MGLINGNKILNVGVQQFDDEHRQLVAIINSLHDAIKSGTGSQAMQETLRQLTEFTGHHFRAEEELLEKHGFPELAEHCQAHQEILKRLAEIRADYQDRGLSVQHNVMQFLLEWLLSHTKSVDKRYGPFLNSRGIY